MPAGTRDLRSLQIIDPVSTRIAIAYTPEGFAYERIVSSMDVGTNSGQYPVWRSADLMRKPPNPRVADRAETPEIDVGYDLESYQLANYRLKVSISPEERSQAHPALRVEDVKTRALIDAMALDREARLAQALRKTDNGGQLTLGGGVSNKWDVTAGTVELDIKGARKAVRDATGQLVDTIIIPWDVAYALALKAEIRELLKYDASGRPMNALELGDRLLPRVLHGLNVEVVGVMQNTAGKGLAQSLSDIWGESVRLIKRAPDNAWGKVATVYALRGQVLATNESSSRRSQAVGGGFRLVDRWAQADPPVDYVRAWEKVQEKVVAASVGYEINDVLT